MDRFWNASPTSQKASWNAWMCNSGGSQDFGCILIQVRNTEIWCDDWCVENDWNDAETTLTSFFVYLTYRFYKNDEGYPFWVVVICQVFKFGHYELRMMAAWLFELARMTANLDDTFLTPRWDGASTIAVYSIINRFGARFKCLRLRHLANAGNIVRVCYLANHTETIHMCILHDEFQGSYFPRF